MKNNNSYISKLNIFLTILFVITGVVGMYFSNANVGKGEELRIVEKKIESLSKENEYLMATYYTMSSLNTVSNKALEEGFAKGRIDFYTTPEFASR